jgi:hypothetical protein
MRRTVTALAATATSVLALSACGGDEGAELTQEQTAEVLLTEEEFPLEGFTRGPVAQQEEGSEATAAPDESLAALIEGQEVPEGCREALESTSFGDDDLAAESSVSFSGDDTTSMLPQNVELVVATTDGSSPLVPLAEVNDECGEIEIEESGVAMTLTFAELESLEGTRLTIGAADQEFEMTMGGRTLGSTVVAVLATGVSEEDVVRVVEAQVEKVQALG